MTREFEQSDEGMSVLTSNGDAIGIITEVRGDYAYVRPSQGLAQGIRRKLGWTTGEKDSYRLRASSIQEFTSDGVHLRDNF